LAENVKLEGALAKKELLVDSLAHEEGGFLVKGIFNKGKN